jgi:predicted RNase H-like nuclease (RuvC/YqgF family)
MNFFIWFLFCVLGCAVGASLTSVLIREKLKKESGQQKLEQEAERVGYADQIQDLRTKINGVREEAKGYWDDLQDEKKKLQEALETSEKIPALESKVERLTAENKQYEEEKFTYLQTIDDLKEELEEERKSLEDCLIFVQGSHYLPGRVVRDLMRQTNDHQ